MIKSSELKKIEEQVKQEAKDLQESLEHTGDWTTFKEVNGLTSGKKTVKGDPYDKVEFRLFHEGTRNEGVGVYIWRKYPDVGVVVQMELDRTIKFYHSEPYPGTEEHIPLEDEDIILMA